jgi:hypothetical protein
MRSLLVWWQNVSIADGALFELRPAQPGERSWYASAMGDPLNKDSMGSRRSIICGGCLEELRSRDAKRIAAGFEELAKT